MTYYDVFVWLELIARDYDVFIAIRLPTVKAKFSVGLALIGDLSVLLLLGVNDPYGVLRSSSSAPIVPGFTVNCIILRFTAVSFVLISSAMASFVMAFSAVTSSTFASSTLA